MDRIPLCAHGVEKCAKQQGAELFQLLFVRGLRLRLVRLRLGLRLGLLGLLRLKRLC